MTANVKRKTQFGLPGADAVWALVEKENLNDMVEDGWDELAIDIVETLFDAADKTLGGRVGNWTQFLDCLGTFNTGWIDAQFFKHSGEFSEAHIKSHIAERLYNGITDGIDNGGGWRTTAPINHLINTYKLAVDGYC